MKNSLPEILLPIACLLFASLLAGCGGGGGSSGGFTGLAAVFDLGKAQDNLYNGSRFNLSGSDNQGSHSRPRWLLPSKRQINPVLDDCNEVANRLM